MKYSIVIPTYNHCDDFLKPCVESILKYSVLEDIEIIISANGCTDNTRDYVNELKYTYGNKIKCVWNDAPSGYPKATNDGIKEAIYHKIVLLNNDAHLIEQNKNQWLEILEKPFKDNPRCGISSVVKEYSKVIDHDYAVFFCVMIDRKVFNTIGLLNEEFGVGSGEDMEFCIRAEDNGFEVHEVLSKQKLDDKYYGGNFPIYHFGEGTVHDESLVHQWASTFNANKIKLARKLNKNWNNMKIMNDRKIGVITPIHNDIDHIFNAVNSVKSQYINNVVHYIFNDASTDGFFRVEKELENDPNVAIINGTVKMGQSNARNILIQKALNDGCELIAFLDSDDVWEPNHLLDSLKAKADYNIVYSKPIFNDSRGNIMHTVNITIPEIFVGKQLYHNNYIWVSSVLADAKCFETCRFDDTLNSIEDWDMWIQLFEKGYTFVSKQETSVKYLVRNNRQASLGDMKMPLFKQKHKMLPKLKLHLACGHDYDDDYINVDLYAPEDARCDVRFDVQKLPYPDNCVDEIKAFHIIEHFNFFEIQKVLEEWYRVLKPGGRLYLETPDFLETCRAFVEGTPHMPIEDWRVLLYGHFFAHPWVPGQTHKFLFTENQLRTNLSWAGFKTINRLSPASKYVLPETVHLFLNVEAFKGKASESFDPKKDLSWLKDKHPHIYDEVIVQNTYSLTREEVENRNVIDIGANVGMFSILAASLGAKVVLAVEPAGETFTSLSDNVKYSRYNNIYCFRNAVYKNNGLVNLTIEEDSGHNNLYTHGERMEQVHTVTLADLVNRVDSSETILKIDCEGAEYDILLNCSPDVFKNISTIHIELHGDTHPLYKDSKIIEDFLENIGYKKVDESQYYGYVYDPNGNIVEYKPIPVKTCKYKK